MGFTRKRLQKPLFDALEKAYLAGRHGAHLCPVATPVDGGISRDEWPTRFCEALMLATDVVPSRTAIAESKRALLGDFSFGLYGRMCPHGVGLDAEAFSKFFSGEWGDPVKLTHVQAPPEALLKKTGIVFFSAERDRGLKAHIDLWNGEKCLGKPFRYASELFFWELHRGAGGSAFLTNGGGGSPAEDREFEKLRASFVRKSEPPPKPEDEKPALRLEYEGKVAALKNLIPAMRQQGFDDEAIARKLHADRRALGEEYKAMTDPELLETIYKRNLEKYGDKLGPTVEWLREKGKTWEQIIDSACRSGGKDLKFGK